MNKLITLIKNKPILSTIILIIIFNEFTDLPLQNCLYNFMPYQPALMISGIALQMSCFGFLMLMAKKLGFSNTFNLNLSKPIKSLWLILPLIMLVLINCFSDMKLVTVTNSPLIFILYTFLFLSTGFIEEMLFRGIGFNLINNKFGKNNKGFYLSLFIPNFLFGFSHITHLFDGTMPLMNFLNQISYATILGIFFTAIYLRCNTLWIPILFHGLIDITGCTNYLSITSPELYFQSLVQKPISYADLFVSFLIFLPLLLWGLFLLRKVKPSYKQKNKCEEAQIIQGKV